MLYQREFLSNALYIAEILFKGMVNNSGSFSSAVFQHAVFTHGKLTYAKLHFYTSVSGSINWLFKMIDDLCITLTYRCIVHVRIASSTNTHTWSYVGIQCSDTNVHCAVLLCAGLSELRQRPFVS